MGNSFTMTPAVGSGSGMTLATARDYVRQFARNAGTSDQYEDADVDRAIRIVGEQFCRNTRFLKSRETVAWTVPGPQAVTADGFRAERVLRAYVEDVAEPLDLVDYEALNRMVVDCPKTADPQWIAFLDDQTAAVWPEPADDFTLSLLVWLPFTTWTPGTASPAAVTFNLPDDVLLQILTFGATATLQYNEPEMRYASVAWQRYQAYEDRMKGAGNLGSRTIHRRKAP